MPVTIPFRLVAGVAVGLVVAAGAGVAAAQTPAVPPTPVVPIPQVPGAETARFRLVLEGEARAIRDLDLGGQNGICNATVNVHIVENSTWRRGLGVTIVFTRLGTGRRAPVLMRRAGRNGIPLFTVNVEATKTSSGTGVRTPAGAPEACPPVTEDLAKGPDCGVPERTDATVGLEYVGGLLKVSLRGLGNVGDNRCPVSEVFGGTPELRYGWPSPLKIRGEVLPPSRIFGTARAFAIRLSAAHVRTSGPFTSGPLSGSVTDFGDNKVTVRFIRL